MSILQGSWKELGSVSSLHFLTLDLWLYTVEVIEEAVTGLIELDILAYASPVQVLKQNCRVLIQSGCSNFCDIMVPNTQIPFNPMRFNTTLTTYEFNTEQYRFNWRG